MTHGTFELTQREREIIQLVSEGLTQSVIAQRLRIAERTVLHHVSSAKTKLNSKTLAQAVATAVKNGIVK